MEDVYTIKVKTKPDTRNLYPSERRYSASTVSGLAWVHIALAATSFLLACLALVNPNSEIRRLTLNDTRQTSIDRTDLIFNSTVFDEKTDDRNLNTESIGIAEDATNGEEIDEITTEGFEKAAEMNGNPTENVRSRDSNYILVLSPTLLTVFALAAGIASVMASARWYIDRNITWLFITSVFSTIFAFISLIMVTVWIITTEERIAELNREKTASKDYFLVRNSEVLDRNESHMIILRNSQTEDEDNSHLFTKRVLSINILIAAFLELLWSILSVKISYKGMRNNYKEDDNERRGNCISVVTTIKGNNTKKLPRNGKLLPPKPDLIDNYPGNKIKRIFLAQNDSGFYLKNQNNKAKQNTDCSSEFYKERMMNFLNRCASLEGMSNPEARTPSVQSEAVLNAIPEVVSVEINLAPKEERNDRVTPVSWGDSPDHTVYNQNTLNFDKIFKYKDKKDKDEENQAQKSKDLEEVSEKLEIVKETNE